MYDISSKRVILKAHEDAYASQIAYIPFLGAGIEIQPLTGSEWAQVCEVRGRDVQVNAPDMGICARNRYQGDILTCRLGLVAEWTEEELGRLPAGTIKQIAAAIESISSTEEEGGLEEIEPAKVISLKVIPDLSGDE